MLRIRKDRLRLEHGLLFREGDLFTGVAYDIDGVFVRRNALVDSGVESGPYDAWDFGVQRALLNELAEIEEGMVSDRFPAAGPYLGTIPFSGIVYEFSEPHGELLREREYSKSGLGAGRDWYASGELAAIETYDRDRDQCNLEAWHPNGTRSSLTLGASLSVHLSEEGRLKSLQLSHPIPAGVLRPPFHVAETLGLDGDGIADEVLDWFVELDKVEQLRLWGTNLSEEGLRRFEVCSQLGRLMTRSNQHMTVDFIRGFAERMRCSWFNENGLAYSPNGRKS